MVEYNYLICFQVNIECLFTVRNNYNNMAFIKELIRYFQIVIVNSINLIHVELKLPSHKKIDLKVVIFHSVFLEF